MKAFNIPWIKLSTKDSKINDYILLSYGVRGARMNQIRSANDKIFEILKNRIEELH